MRIERGQLNAWFLLDQYKRIGESTKVGDQNQANPANNDRVEGRLFTKVAHQESSERSQESQTYNREGQRVPYISPGQSFEAQG